MNLTEQPAVTLGLITTAVTSVIAALVAFGINLTPVQQVAILGIIAGVGPILVGLIVRPHVTPSALVAVKVKPGVGFVAADALRSVDNDEPVDVVAIHP
jgi:hypothetical protein